MSSYEKSLYMGHLSTVPMFCACSTEELEHIADRATLEPVPDGKALVTEGEAGDKFYVIATGTAKVVRGGQEVATLGRGDFFGELALFDDAPRDASVVAEGDDTSAVVIGRAAFNELLGEVASMRDSLLRGMAHRLHVLDAEV
jgi:cAMP-dependent protein kinase regulator